MYKLLFIGVMITSLIAQQPVIIKDTSGNAAAVSGTSLSVNVSNASIPVTGTFWQTTQPVSGTVTANAGTGTFNVSAAQSGNWSIRLQDGSGNAINSTSNALNVNLQNSSVAVTGTFWQATQPVSGTFWQSTQPVSIATMPSTPVTGTFWQTTQPVSGTFWQSTQPISGTVQPGNTQNTTPWLANPIPAATSTYAFGAAPYTNNATSTSTYANVKASAGNVYGWDVLNPNTSTCWLQFYNSATPTLGTSVIFAVPVLGSGGAARTLSFPVNFSTAISIVTATTATGGTACSTGMQLALYYQ